MPPPHSLEKLANFVELLHCRRAFPDTHSNNGRTKFGRRRHCDLLGLGSAGQTEAKQMPATGARQCSGSGTAPPEAFTSRIPSLRRYPSGPVSGGPSCHFCLALEHGSQRPVAAGFRPLEDAARSVAPMRADSRDMPRLSATCRAVLAGPLDPGAAAPCPGRPPSLVSASRCTFPCGSHSRISRGRSSLDSVLAILRSAMAKRSRSVPSLSLSAKQKSIFGQAHGAQSRRRGLGHCRSAPRLVFRSPCQTCCGAPRAGTKP